MTTLKMVDHYVEVLASLSTALPTAVQNIESLRKSLYTMACPPVRGDNPRALASGLSYVQVDKHGIYISYH